MECARRRVKHALRKRSNASSAFGCSFNSLPINLEAAVGDLDRATVAYAKASFQDVAWLWVWGD